MNPARAFTVAAVALGLSLAGRAGGGDSDTFGARVRPFVERHCLACHGPEARRGRLRLDALPAALDDPDTFAAWVKILDRVARGEMPPKSDDRPPEAEARPFLAGLGEQLHAASLARQRRDGRVVLRRLNRTEYETTLRDLVGGPVEVKGLLPDDNVAAGFDNVAAVLDVSPAHLLRYQEAADKALRAVIPTRPPADVLDRRTGRQVVGAAKDFQDLLDKVVRLDGDALVMYVRPYSHTPCATAPAPQAGRYRVRASVRAVGTGGRPLPVLFARNGTSAVADRAGCAVRDASADRPAAVEVDLDLQPRDVVHVSGWTLPAVRDADQLTRRGPLAEYAGPGLAVEWVELQGPLGPWPPAGYDRLFPGVPLKPASVLKAQAERRPYRPDAKRPDGWWLSDPLTPAPHNPWADAEQIMRAALPGLFRRPVGPDVQARYVKVVDAALKRRVPFPEALLQGYKAALCSPHFLFLLEPPGPLDDYALASRLSYFLWSSGPDAELLRLAAAGELARPAVLRAQVDRLLGDPRGHRFTANFVGQWLDLRNIDATFPDPAVYGEFDDQLYWSLPQETELFFEEVLRADRSLTEFVQSDWTFLNERLARHYGIADVWGGEFRKVRLPAGTHRGGVLTHASVLKVTADGTKTSPVLRGKWVLDRILGRPPDPPPPDTPAIDPDIRGATTIRRQLDKHRHTPACATCHRHIDPPGFALETFDVIGGWREFYRATRPVRAGRVALPNYPGRTVYRGPDVETGGETPDGRQFRDVDDYKRLLLADKDQLARNLAAKLIVYATGADIQFADREVVEDLVAQSRANNYGFRSLVHAVVQSRVFRTK